MDRDNLSGGSKPDRLSLSIFAFARYQDVKETLMMRESKKNPVANRVKDFGKTGGSLPFKTDVNGKT